MYGDQGSPVAVWVSLWCNHFNLHAAHVSRAHKHETAWSIWLCARTSKTEAKTDPRSLLLLPRRKPDRRKVSCQKEVATGGIDSIQWFYSLCALAGSTTPSNCWSARARFAGNNSALPLFSGVSVDMLLVRWLNGALVGSRNHSSVSSTPISSAAVLLHEKVCNNPRSCIFIMLVC